MVFGAGLMRCGWLRGKFSLRHYRRLALFLISLSLVIQIPGVALQVYVGWDYRWAGFLLQVPRELGGAVAGGGVSGAALRVLANIIPLGYQPLAGKGWPYGAE